MTAPLPFTWDGESFCPASPYVARLCDKRFAVGETYHLDEANERSAASHAHYFASVSEAWKNLPESFGDQFPTPDHLRKWVLIKCGYRDERSIVCASKAEAQRVAAFVKPMDEFAAVLVREAVVLVYTAKSQSMRAMGKAEFQASKTAVLDELAAMTGVSRSALEQNAGKAA